MQAFDIFNNDAFSLAALTKSVNDVPYTPGRIGELNLFAEEGISTVAAMIERRGTTLSLVQSAPRGGVAVPDTNDKRQMIPFATAHLPKRGSVNADEVQNLRAFGSESNLETVQSVVTRKLSKMKRDLEVTIEYHRMGAIKGVVLDADGTTELNNLYNAFGLVQQNKAMALSTAATKIKQKVTEAKRMSDTALGGFMAKSHRGFCSSSFFDAFVGHATVEKAYDRYLDGQLLRSDSRGGFWFCEVWWEEYRGGVGGVDFIAPGEAYLVPEGIPDMFVTHYAPANYMETVNTIGLPYYAKQEVKDFNTGVMLEAQSNPLCINTRPSAVIKLTA
jgi:Phage major capsid protein E